MLHKRGLGLGQTSEQIKYVWWTKHHRELTTKYNPRSFLCVVSGKWLAKWAFGLMHYGKDKGTAKTTPSVPLRRGKAPDKHMVYSILLSLGGPGWWAIQWGVPLRTGCFYLHFIIANRCPPLQFHCFTRAQFLYRCPFDKAVAGLCI